MQLKSRSINPNLKQIESLQMKKDRATCEIWVIYLKIIQSITHSVNWRTQLLQIAIETMKLKSHSMNPNLKSIESRQVKREVATNGIWVGGIRMSSE